MRIAAAVAVWLALIAAPAEGATVFDSGNADGRMAMGSRPASSGMIAARKSTRPGREV